jgi:hypothetical protein
MDAGAGAEGSSMSSSNVRIPRPAQNTAFWTYFRDRLRFGLIAKPGPLQALVRGTAHRLDTVRDDAAILRAQWFPQLCEPELVPAYGTSRGITRHHTETPEQFRSRVLNAYAWHLLGGKQEGLPEILRFYGFDIARIDNLRKYQPSRWAEFQVGLINPETLAAQGDILRSLETLIWLINEYKPARSVLARMYTDVYNVTPLIWSDGRWSAHYYSYFSGVPAADLGPEFGRYPGLILSFGLRYAVESEAPGGDFGRPIFCGLQRQGFIAPYVDAPVWSFFRWGDDFPHKHGFSVMELYSADWCDRIVSSAAWTDDGGWDERKWVEWSSWDRVLPPWEMHNRGIARSQLVYDDPFLFGRSGGGEACSGGEASSTPPCRSKLATLATPSVWEPPAGGWGGLNACWSLPYVVRIGQPVTWSVTRWADGVDRHLAKIGLQRLDRHTVYSLPPVYPAGTDGAASLARGFSGAATPPLHNDTWTGRWDDRRWNDYIAHFSVTSIIEEAA